MKNGVIQVKEKLIQQICALFLQKVEQVKLIYIFGSYATDLQTTASDIDIAVLTNKTLDPVERWKMESELAERLGKDVDLIDLLSASTVMQHQIIQYGLCIYDPENKAAFFEMQVMAMYQHLNEERADILKQHLSAEL